MKKKLIKTLPPLHYFARGMRIEGAHCFLLGNYSELWGDCTGIHGDVTGLHGNATGLSGDCTLIVGDCTNFSGSFDDCEITELTSTKELTV